MCNTESKNKEMVQDRVLQTSFTQFMSKALDYIENADIIDSLPILIMMFHHETGEIKNANKMLCDYLGYTKEELKLKTFFDLLPDYELKRTTLALQDFHNNEKQGYIFKNHYLHKDGKTRPIYWIRSGEEHEVVHNYSFAVGLKSINFYE